MNPGASWIMDDAELLAKEEEEDDETTMDFEAAMGKLIGPDVEVLLG